MSQLRTQRFSQKTISRVLRYTRILEEAMTQGEEMISSAVLASRSGVSDAQIRKDVSFFGRIGRPRIGYRIADLQKVFGDYVLQNTVHVALFGVGHLGAAILRYPGFDKDKIQIVGAFDKDPGKIGKVYNGVKVYDIADAGKMVKKIHAEIGINATPVETSQQVADTMVASGLKGIVNFAPTTLTMPSGVFVRNIDFTIEFLSLFCDIQNGQK